MIKSIYAQPRKPGLTRDQFVRLWRAHGALAMSQPGFWDPVQQYIQADPLPDASEFPGASTFFDGVGEIHFANAEARAASRASRERSEVVVPDGNRMLGHNGAINLAVAPTPILSGRSAQIKTYIFVKSNDPENRAPFLKAWDDSQHEFLKKNSHLAKAVTELVSWHSIDESSAYDGVLEISTDTVEDAATVYQEWRMHLDAAVSPSPELVVIPTKALLLYDRSYFAS